MKKIDSALQYLQEKHYADFASTYGEPGYSDPQKGIIFANWNNTPSGLSDWLEKCGYSLEWSDEWTTVNDKAYRTNADSYHWQSQIMLTNDCEYLTPYDAPSDWIEQCQITSNGQPIHCLPSWISHNEIEGFTLHNSDCESGWFPGQTDNPELIARELFKNGAYRVLFRKLENSQFYCKFSVYVDMGEV